MHVSPQLQHNLREASEPEHPGIGSPPFLSGQIREPLQSESASQSPTHLEQGEVGEQLSEYESTPAGEGGGGGAAWGALVAGERPPAPALGSTQ